MENEFLLMECSGHTFELMEASGANAKPAINMCAYTGGVMSPSVSNREGPVRVGPVVVDIEGIEIPCETVPVVFQHDENKPVGNTTEITKTPTELTARGFLSRDTDESREILSSWKLKYPWKPSIALQIFERRNVPEGESVTRNGRSFSGPITLVTRSRLCHIGIVDNPGDRNAWLSLQAQKTREEGRMATENQMDIAVELAKFRQEMKQDREEMLKAMREEMANSQRLAEEEQLRASKIAEVAANHPEIREKALRDKWTAERAELEVLRTERNKPTDVKGGGQGASDALMLEAACALNTRLFDDEKLVATYGERVVETADKRFRHAGLMELGRAAGIEPRYLSNMHEWLRAFSTTSLPGILSNIANKSLLDSLQYTNQAWREICKIGSVKDFKETTRYRMYGDFKFRPRGEGGKLKHAEGLTEEEFKMRIAMQGVMFTLTREILINDDLGAIKDIPQQIGIGWGETLSDSVWVEFMSDATLSDGTGFYSADNHSLLTGQAMTMEGLEAAWQEFNKKTLPNGRLLGRQAEILLVPVALEPKADELMKATSMNETTTANKRSPNYNRVARLFPKLVSVPFLQDTNLSANASTTTFYLVGNRVMTPCIEIAFLGGKENPEVTTAEADFDECGIKFRGIGDFGVKKQDCRGVLRVTA